MNTQHTGNTFTPCPIARMRRKMIVAAMMVAVGMSNNAAMADAPTGEIGYAPVPAAVLKHRALLPVVMGEMMPMN